MPEIPRSDLSCIFAAYVTTKAPAKVIEDLIESSANAWPSKDQVKSPYLFSIIRNKAEVSREQDRIKDLSTLSGTQPPVSETEEYDFLDANLYDLAKFTIDTFPDDYSISNSFILVVDERSVKDRTCILVEIPEQSRVEKADEKPPAVKRERKFHRRGEYVPDPEAWAEEADKYAEEIKAVRVRFEDAHMANMLDDGHEDMWFLASFTYQTDGVYKEGMEYTYPGSVMESRMRAAAPL